jgi:hypothetical protein
VKALVDRNKQLVLQRLYDSRDSVAYLDCPDDRQLVLRLLDAVGAMANDVSQGLPTSDVDAYQALQSCWGLLQLHGWSPQGIEVAVVRYVRLDADRFYSILGTPRGIHLYKMLLTLGQLGWALLGKPNELDHKVVFRLMLFVAMFDAEGIKDD